MNLWPTLRLLWLGLLIQCGWTQPDYRVLTMPVYLLDGVGPSEDEMHSVMVRFMDLAFYNLEGVDWSQVWHGMEGTRIIWTKEPVGRGYRGLYTRTEMSVQWCETGILSTALVHEMAHLVRYWGYGVWGDEGHSGPWWDQFRNIEEIMRVETPPERGCW